MAKLPIARIMTKKPDPIFEQPWHAQIFALTVTLNERAHFSWSEWAERFGTTLQTHGLAQSLNGGDDYFLAWLDALESLLAGRGVVQADELGALKIAWTEAYLSKSRGAHVRID